MRGGVIPIKRIQVTKPAFEGMSGLWVGSRSSQEFLGMVYGVEKKAPYVCMIPAEDILTDIVTFLNPEAIVQVTARERYLIVVKKLLQEISEKDNTSPEAARLEGWKGLYVETLYEASRSGHLNVVRFLTDVTATDIEFLADNAGTDIDSAILYETPLMAAAENGHLDVVRYLLHKGARQSCRNGEGETALLKASKNGHVQIVELLLSDEAIGLPDNRGRTCLAIAARNGQEEIVRFLLQNRPGLCNVRDDAGWTALFEAIAAGHEGVVELLLSTDVDCNTPDYGGQTPMACAIRGGYQRIVDLLYAS